MGILWLILGAGLVALVVAGTLHRNQSPDTSASAMATLKDRYARGELSRDEFEQKARDIRGA